MLVSINQVGTRAIHVSRLDEVTTPFQGLGNGHGSGEQLKHDPEYRREVRRTAQQTKMRQRYADRVRNGYGDDEEADFGDDENMKEGEIININRGGNNKLRNKEDYLDKRDHLYKLLIAPGISSDDRAIIKDRLMQLEKAKQLAGIE